MGMFDPLYLAETIVLSPVKRLGWRGFLGNCCGYSWRYLIGFLIWILCGVVGHLILISFLFGIGFQANQQQPNPPAKPWAGLLLFPFILGIGFLAKFIDSRNWVFRPREIVVHSMTNGTRVDLCNIKSITIQISGNYEIWRIEKNDGGEPEVGVFRQTTHNRSMKKRLLEQSTYDGMTCLITHVG
jgi:hypothetical protein